MIAYLLLGLGFFVVFLSVIYTYRINREVDEFENHWGMRSATENIERPTTLVDLGKGLEGNINGLVGQLERIIVDLREKEIELTQILEKARQWEFKLSDKAFADILQQEILSLQPLEVQPQKEGSRAKSSAIQEQAVLPKYEQIIKLSTEGLTVSEIAQKLNLGHREVDLVVKMNSKEAETDV